MKKSLVIAIAGAPNAGKSTLINQLIGQKIAIVTPKCQTTRFNTKGVVNLDETQLVFIDTPGLFSPDRPLEQNIVKQACVGLEEADIVCFMVDSYIASSQDFSVVMKHLKRVHKPVVLLLNKTDLLKDKTGLLTLTEHMTALYPFDAVFMISAKKGKDIDKVLDYFKNQATEGPWLFEDDVASNITDRKLAEEITRECLYHALGSELPYSLEVCTEIWEEYQNGSVKINQIIHILKDSQKKIILGSKGQKLKSVGQAAREQLAKIFERPVHLFLYVKVKPDWIERSVPNIDMHML